MDRQPEVPNTARWAIGLSFTFAVGVGVLRAANTEPALRSIEAAGNLAFAVVVALPALLGLLGLRRRPSLLVAAGLLDLALGFVTLISLVGVAFLAPGMLFLVSTRRVRPGSPGPARSVAAVIACSLLGTGAFVMLFVHEDPACWARTGTGRYVRIEPEPYVDGSSITVPTPPGTTESGCTSDTISPFEAVLATAFVGLTLGVGWVIARPTEPGPESPEIAGDGAYASAP